MSHLKFLDPIWQAGGEIYEVGGSVRDRLLERPVKDRDLLIRKIPMQQLATLLQPYGKIAQVGKSFGILKFTPNQDSEQTFDIALPRKERSTGVGHRDFEVQFDPTLSLEEDLKRRDFTINAMALDLKTDTFIDPLGGMVDLQAKHLKQVFEKTFEEDPLRLIRAVQFAARFDLQIEEKTKAAMKQSATLIQTVSPERIIEEIRKLFLAEKPSRGFELMRETGILKIIFPEIEDLIGIAQDKLPDDDVYGHTLRVLDATCNDPVLDHPHDLELMFAALFHDIGKKATQKVDPKKSRTVFYGHQWVSKKLAKRWMQRMKITILGVNPENIEVLVLNHMFDTKSYFADKAIRRFIHKISPELIFKLLDLRLADNRGGKHPKSVKGVLKMRERVREVLAQKPPFGPGDLAINGHDLMHLGVTEGPNIGKILKQLVSLVLDDPTLNTQEHLLTVATEMKEKLK